MSIKQTLQPWKSRQKPCNCNCENLTGFLSVIAKAERSKVGIQEYTSEDPENPKVYKKESFSATWSVTTGAGTSSGSISSEYTYNAKSGEISETHEGSVNDRDYYIFELTYDEGGDLIWESQNENSGNLLFMGTFGPYGHPQSFPKALSSGGTVNSYDGGSGSLPMYTISSVSITSTSHTVNGTVSYGSFSGSFSFTWTLSEEFTDTELETQVNELLAEIDLATVPFNSYGGTNISVSANYGGCDADNTVCNDSFQTAVDAANDALDEAESALAALVTALAGLESDLVTAEGELTDQQEAYNEALDALDLAQRETKAAQINLQTLTGRGSDTTAADARYTAAVDEEATKSTEYYSALSLLDTKKNEVTAALTAIGQKNLEIKEAEYQVELAEYALAVAEQNQTRANGNKEAILLSIGGISDGSAFYNKTGTTLTKQKIRYRLWSRLAFFPKTGDSTVDFAWREFDSVSQTFTDKSLDSVSATATTIDYGSSYWQRIVWTEFYSISAPTSNRSVFPVGISLSPLCGMLIQSAGGIQQKVGFSEYVPSDPPRIFKKETISDVGFQELEYDGFSFYEYATDFDSPYPPFRSTLPWEEIGQQPEPVELSATSKTLSDGTVLTLSEEFTLAELQAPVDENYLGGFEEPVDFTDTGIYVSNNIAYYIFPEDETCYGKNRLKLFFGFTLPASYPYKDEELTISATYTEFARNLTTGEITIEEKTLEFVFPETISSRTVNLDPVDLEVTTRNELRWVSRPVAESNIFFWDDPTCSMTDG